MHHETGLIVTIAAGFLLAFAFGFVARKLKLPPLVGYLAAGIAVGPHTPGITADAGLAGQLAEIGVILLMFGVGLHFSIEDFRAVRKIAVPGAVVQIAIATLLGAALAFGFGWNVGAATVFGLSLSVASTVVLLRALEERNLLSGSNGRIAVGWLVVEDLVMVLALVLLPAFAGILGGAAASGGGSFVDILGTAALTVLRVGLFVALVLLVGPRLLPPLLREVARLGSRELFTLAVLSAALGIAFLSSAVFGVSFALGAFCAGMVLSKSEFSHRAASESLPLQDAFAVLFFVSVGMLFEPAILVERPVAVLLTVLVIVVGKALAGAAIVFAIGYPLSTAVVVGAGLAQIGEFSFILAGLGVGLGLLAGEGRDLILAGAIASITLNPGLFRLARMLETRLAGAPALAAIERRGARHLAALTRALAAEDAQEAAKAAPRITLQSEEVAGRFPIFGRLDGPARAELVALFEPRNGVPGERLIRRGDVAEELLFVSAGMVEVRVGDRLIEVGAGEFVGEMGVLSGEPRSADVVALDYVELYVLTRKDLLAFLSRHPELRRDIGGVADRRREMNAAAPPATEAGS